MHVPSGLAAVSAPSKAGERVPAPARDFFDDPYGEKRGLSWRGRTLGRITDPLFDLPLAWRGQARRLSEQAALLPVRRILVASVEAPGREAQLGRVLQALRQTRHDVTVALAPMAGRGKFQNINAALQGHDLAGFDWLLVTDDDVAVPPGFLDRFIALAELEGLKLCQPAHRFHSHARFELTLRAWNCLVRRTNFVECGPVTAFHRDAFSLLLPFAESRWAWGSTCTGPSSSAQPASPSASWTQRPSSTSSRWAAATISGRPSRRRRRF